jgi:hypothetical protein
MDVFNFHVFAVPNLSFTCEGREAVLNDVFLKMATESVSSIPIILPKSITL